MCITHMRVLLLSVYHGLVINNSKFTFLFLYIIMNHRTIEVNEDAAALSQCLYCV